MFFLVPTATWAPSCVQLKSSMYVHVCSPQKLSTYVELLDILLIRVPTYGAISGRANIISFCGKTMGEVMCAKALTLRFFAILLDLS